MSKINIRTKKISFPIRFAPLGCVLFGIIFIAALDGFNILTYSWERHKAFITDIQTVNYPINTKTRGTINGTITYAEINYTINGYTFVRDIVGNKISTDYDTIEVRVNPRDHGMVTPRDYHTSLYVLFLIIAPISLILSVIYLLKVKETNI